MKDHQRHHFEAPNSEESLFIPELNETMRYETKNI
jgi:hypothetical protein